LNSIYLVKSRFKKESLNEREREGEIPLRRQLVLASTQLEQ